MTSIIEPALTIVSVPAHHMGAAAIRADETLIGGRKPRPRRAVLDIELAVHESYGRSARSGYVTSADRRHRVARLRGVARTIHGFLCW